VGSWAVNMHLNVLWLWGLKQAKKGRGGGGGEVPCSIYQDAILPRPYQAIIQNHPTTDAIHFMHAL